jgi:tetratricopeptide (TPR) repeat protein
VADPASRIARVGALTTHSLPALEAYLRGEREYRAGRYHAAVDLFQAAAEADTTFALAYYRLALASRWASMRRPEEVMERARRYAVRLPERERRLVEAMFLVESGGALAAERLYREVIAMHPDDIEAWYELGEVLFHWKPMLGGSVANARDAFLRVVALDPDHAGALEHLARIAGAEGDFLEMRRLARRVVQLETTQPAIGVLLLAGSPADSAARRRLRTADAHTLAHTTALLAAFADDLDGARSIAAELIATDRYNHLPAGTLSAATARGSGFVLLAGVELAAGRLKDARSALASARQLQPAAALEMESLITAFTVLPYTPPALDSLIAAVLAAPTGIEATPLALGHDERRALTAPRRLLMLALLEERRGDVARARSHVAELEAMAAAPHTREADVGPAREHARLAGAYLAWRAGRNHEALDRLGEARARYNLPTAASYPAFLDRLLRAEVYRSLGRHEAALTWYGTFPDGSGYDYPFLPLTYLRRAQILDGAGRHDEARRFHARFAALWKDCDAELQPLPQHARSRALSPR